MNIFLYPQVLISYSEPSHSPSNPSQTESHDYWYHLLLEIYLDHQVSLCNHNSQSSHLTIDFVPFPKSFYAFIQQNLTSSIIDSESVLKLFGAFTYQS